MMRLTILSLGALAFGSGAVGCGYLDDDLHLSDHEFERSFAGGLTESLSARTHHRGPHARATRMSTTLGFGRITIQGGSSYHIRLAHRLQRHGRITHLYENLCRGRTSRTCRSIAYGRALGLGTHLRADALRTELDRDCHDDRPRACYRLAIMLHAGLGGPRDPDRADRLLDSACRKGVEAACQTKATRS